MFVPLSEAMNYVPYSNYREMFKAAERYLPNV